MNRWLGLGVLFLLGALLFGLIIGAGWAINALTGGAVQVPSQYEWMAWAIIMLAVVVGASCTKPRSVPYRSGIAD